MSDADAELIDGVLRCRFEALATIYEQHSADVHGLARRLCGPHADEVVRRVFLTLWRAPEAYDAERGSLGDHLSMLTAVAAHDQLSSGANAHDRRASAELPVPVDVDLTRTSRTGLGDIQRAISRRGPFGADRRRSDRRDED